MKPTPDNDPAEPSVEALRRIRFCLDHGTDHLNLAGLGLAALPEAFGELTGLRYLDLTDNLLEKLPDGLSGFSDLLWLGLNFNRLTTIEGIESLVDLRRLYLRGNLLESLPAFFGNLVRLVELDLTGNRIERLPDSMGHLAALEVIALESGALVPDQRAAFDEGKWESLRSQLRRADEFALHRYREELMSASGAHSADLNLTPVQMTRFGELLNGTVTMSEFRQALALAGFERQAREVDAAEVLPVRFLGKVILVGDEGQGKTCLQRALRGEAFVAGHRSTPGMNRTSLSLAADGRLIPPDERATLPGPHSDVIDLQIWDMGGQRTYQFTHQLFFTPAAIYLAVSRPRNEAGSGVPELRRWLDLVHKRTGGEARVLIVWTDSADGKGDESLKRESLQVEYGDMILGIVAVDSRPAQGAADGPGIAALRKKLAQIVTTDGNGFAHQWQPGWAAVLDEFSILPKAYLRWPEVAAICERHGVTDESNQRVLVRTGHLIGALLWRTDTPQGADVVVLNPDWLNRAVARLLDDPQTATNRGLIYISDLPRVWNCPDREGNDGYHPDLYDMLVTLMEINELAYRPRQPGKKVGEGDLLLVTQLVEATPPADLEEKWESRRPERSMEASRIVTFNKRDTLGAGEVPDLMYLLIFRLRAFSLGRRDFQRAVHWRRGMLVEDAYGSVGRIEQKDGELRILIRYRLGEGLLHSIDAAIGDKDDVAWQGLTKVVHVACGQHCQRPAGRLGDAGRIRLDDCDEALRCGDKNVQCLREDCRKRLPIDKLLGGPAVSDDRRALNEQMTHVLADLGTLKAGQVNALSTIMIALKGMTEDLLSANRMEGDNIIRALTSEGREGPRLFSVRPVDGWRIDKWTHITMELTLWCEASRWPVPFCGHKAGADGRGNPSDSRLPGVKTIRVERAWVRQAAKLLRRSMWLMIGYKVAAAAGAAKLAGLAGISPALDPPAEFLGNLADEWEAIKEIEESLGSEAPEGLEDLAGESAAADGEHPWTVRGRMVYGSPIPKDDPVTRFFRDEYRKQDPDWGGLKAQWDSQFGWIWAHPRHAEFDEGES